MVVRLALGFALALTLLVGGSGIFLYGSIEQIVYAQVHREFTTAARLVLHKLDEDHLPPDKEMLDVGEHFMVRIMDEAQRPLLATRGMDEKFPQVCLPQAAGPWTWQQGARTSEHAPRTLLIRHPGGWIQISRDLKPEEELLRRFFHPLLVLLLTTPFLGGALGWGMVRLGLKPLGELETAAGTLGPENLTVRLPVTRLPRELVPLATALNGSLASLEGAFQRLTELNSDLAHELRSPVHSLRLEVESMLSREAPNPELEDHLVGMMGTLDHLAALIEQMLFLARWEEPATRVDKTSVPVAPLLQTVLGPFEPLAEENQITLRIEAEPGLAVEANSTLLRRALHNLLDNAIRHSPAGSAVRLSAHRTPEGIELAVSDQGEGIPAAFLATLGQRFARTDAARDRKRGGAGLGLAIVNGIAKLHGAQFAIKSQEGVGTVATITFAGF
jgi:two-component system heavy metal sensor histidine kinase CusS